MAKTYNPYRVKTQETTKFRGTANAENKLAVPSGYVDNVVNLVSFEQRTMTVRPGCTKLRLPKCELLVAPLVTEDYNNTDLSYRERTRTGSGTWGVPSYYSGRMNFSSKAFTVGVLMQMPSMTPPPT